MLVFYTPKVEELYLERFCVKFKSEHNIYYKELR